MGKLSVYGKEVTFDDKMKTYGLVMPGENGPEYGEIDDVPGMVKQICSQPREVALRKIRKIIDTQRAASEIIIGKIPDPEYLSIVNTVELFESIREACKAVD